MSQGNIVQCIGAVVDIQFPRDAMPHVYNALQLDKAEESEMCEADLMFEVQQQLGDGIVRTIAMGSSDGLPWCVGMRWLTRPTIAESPARCHARPRLSSLACQIGSRHPRAEARLTA